jgi:hypothetical protein
MYEEKWLADNYEEIPDVRYGHIVFTFPHELNWYWLGAKEKVTDALFDTVSETLTEIYEHEYGITPGLKLYLHTWNAERNVHLHIHSIVTVGGITKEGKWKERTSDYIIPMEAVLIKFKGKLAYKLRGLKMSGILPESSEEIIKKIEKKKMNVHLCDEYEGNGENIFRYLAKRARGGALKDIKFYDAGRNKILMEYKKAGILQKKLIRGEELLKRFFKHIPETGQKMVRGYGIFAGSKKKQLLKVVEELGHLQVTLKEYKGKVICEKCEAEMLPHREIKSRKQEFIEGMIKEGSEISDNKIRYFTKKSKIEQLRFIFKKVV